MKRQNIPDNTHWAVDILSAIAIACLLVPCLATHVPFHYLFINRTPLTLTGVIAILSSVLLICWPGANRYFIRYRSTWLLERKPKLPIDDVSVMLAIAVAICSIFRVPHGLHLDASYRMSVAIMLALFTAWLVSAYYFIPKAKTSDETSPQGEVELSDEPIKRFEQDELDRTGFVKSLAEDITTLPFRDSFVFGITAEWGEGKTSVINLLKQTISQKDDFFIVEYTPWFYESDDALLSAFYGLIEQDINRQLIIPNLKKTIIKYQQVIKNGLNLSGVNIDFSLNNQTPGELKKLIEGYLEITGKKMLIIVDELDRLQSHELMFVLQLIRLNTNLKNTVFLLSYDPKIIRDNLPEPYNDDFKYLEKIIQRQVPLPAVQQKTIDTYVFEQLSSLLDKLNIVGENRTEFDKDFGYTYQTLFTYFLRTLRSSKQFLNIVSSSLPAIANEVELEDFMVLELIHYAAPDLYSDIWQNAWAYIPTDWSKELFTFAGSNHDRWSFDKENMYPTIKQHIENVLKVNKDKDALLELLQKVFCVTVKNAYARSPSGMDGMIRSYRRDKRITHPDIFTKFYLGKVPLDELPDAEFDTMLTHWKNSRLVADRKATMQSDIDKIRSENKISELLRKLNTFTQDIPSQIAKDLIMVLTDNIAIFNRKSHADLFRSDFEQCIAAIFRIMNEQIPANQIQPLLKRIVTHSDDHAFNANVITWCDPGVSHTLQVVTANADISVLRSIVERKLKTAFIDTGADIFRLYPEPIDWGHLIYQWSRGWGQLPTPSAEVNMYLKNVFEENYLSFRMFVESYIYPHRSENADEYLFRIDEMKQSYDLQIIRNVAQKYLGNDDVSRRDSKMITCFVVEADKILTPPQPIRPEAIEGEIVS